MEVAASPTFYQAVTDVLFKEMIISQTAVKEPELPPVQQVTVENAYIIRYAAGYVCWKVYDKINGSKHTNRDDLMACTLELVDQKWG